MILSVRYTRGFAPLGEIYTAATPVRATRVDSCLNARHGWDCCAIRQEHLGA